jgi:hypothetical protein
MGVPILSFKKMLHFNLKDPDLVQGWDICNILK